MPYLIYARSACDNLRIGSKDDTTDMNQTLKVAVIGGSISGCTVAAELVRAGWDVMVFERSAGNLEDRGAGIGMPWSLINTMKQRDLVDRDMAYVPVTERHFVVRSDKDDDGRIIWKQPMALAATNWDVLYRNIRSRVPNEVYHKGSFVKELIDMGERGVKLCFDSGKSLAFDLAICADGYRSIGRNTLYPERQTQYSGYVLWRGLLEEKYVTDLSRFDGLFTYVVTKSGHCVLYVVPGSKNEIEAGKRRLNWAWYENVPSQNIPVIFGNRRSSVGAASLPPGAVSERQKVRLFKRAKRLLPGFVSDVICGTNKLLMQGIFDVQVPSYQKGRICLIGDAAAVARPHVVGGAVKAITNSITLVGALSASKCTEFGLVELGVWDREQCAEGTRLVLLGQIMGDALQSEDMSWDDMSESDMQAWWENVIRMDSWYVVDDASEAN